MSDHLSLPITASIPTPTLTLGRAKRNVARVIGNEEDTETRARAEDALAMAVAEWNRRHQFDARALVSADVPIVAGTDTYDLPSDFLKMYSVRLVDSNRDLNFSRRRLYDRTFWDQSVQSWSTHYTLWGSGATGQIVLLPPPGEADTMRLRYYAAVMLPSRDNDTFGLPDRYAWGLVFKAKALLLMDKNAEDPRIPMWVREAEIAFRQARADDSEYPDEDLRMIPSIEHGRRAISTEWPAYFGE